MIQFYCCMYTVMILNSSALPKRLIGVFESVYESDNSPTLRLTTAWRDVILESSVIELFFTLYWKVRSNPQLAHHARNCLVQLASLNGVIMQSNEVKMQYLKTYMQNFLKLLSNIEIIDQEAIGIANIFKKLILFFGSEILTLQDNSEDMLRQFMEQMTRLTCMFAEGASQEESVSKPGVHLFRNSLMSSLYLYFELHL